MENASKALIMAGSILIALMIIGALLLMFNNLSTYQESNVETTRDAQVVEFNNQFVTYNRDNIRGSDIVSLMNRAIDYNERKTGTTSNEQYQEMTIKINGIKPADYRYSDKSLLITKTSYTQDTFKNVLDTATDIEDDYEKGNKSYISTLVTNIAKVMDERNAEQEIKNILNTNDLNTFGKKVDKIQNDTCIYYEYTQFKRVYFDCQKVEYNNQTGRIIYMEFKCNGKFN